MLIKICRKCHAPKSVNRFGKSSNKSVRRMCLKCQADKNREYYKTRPKRTPEYQRELVLKSRYGITQVQYETMLVAQNSVCAICKNSPKYRRLDIDHCHNTKIIRGILCSDCNVGISKFKDNPELLEEAIKYLVHNIK